jgi:hypothetical protein
VTSTSPDDGALITATTHHQAAHFMIEELKTT